MAIAVVALRAGSGFLALIYCRLGGSVVATAIAIFCSPWRPRWTLSLAPLRPLIGYSINVVTTKMLSILNVKATDLIIGMLANKDPAAILAPLEGRLASVSIVPAPGPSAGAADPGDGHNVVIHEFAHQLDQEAGSANGAPWLSTPARRRRSMRRPPPRRRNASGSASASP